MKPTLRQTIVPLIAIVASAVPSFAAEDAPPPDVGTILRTLDALAQQHSQQENSLRQRALQEAQAAAANPAHAAELWEQAEKVSKDAAQFRAWKDGEGSALNAKEVQNALRIHFNWLVLTLQKSGGAKTRDLLPAVIAHTKDATADQLAMEEFDEQLKKQKELADKSGRQGPREREKRNDEAVKALRGKIANQSVKSSPVAQMLRLGEIMDDAGVSGRQGRKQDAPQDSGKSWEGNPFNVDGIFQSIILPELRAQKDIRILEYWDNKIRVAADRASKSKSPLEIDKFNQVVRPQMQWDRAVEMENIGFRNRAIGEMFSIVKANPAHPNVEGWMKDLKTRIQPQAPADATASAAPGAVSPAKGQ